MLEENSQGRKPRQLVFVGGLPMSVKDDELKQHFEQFTAVESAKVNIDRKTKKSKGFAIVAVPMSTDLKWLLSVPHIIAGRRVDCQEAVKKSEKRAYKEDLKRRKLFVTGLPRTATNESLGAYFSQYASIRTAYVVKDSTTTSKKRYGYIEFVNEFDACAVFAHNSFVFDGNQLTLSRFDKSLSMEESSPSNFSHHPLALPKSQHASPFLKGNFHLRKPKDDPNWFQPNMVYQAPGRKFRENVIYSNQRSERSEQAKEYLLFSGKINVEADNYGFRPRIKNHAHCEVIPVFSSFTGVFLGTVLRTMHPPGGDPAGHRITAVRNTH